MSADLLTAAVAAAAAAAGSELSPTPAQGYSHCSVKTFVQAALVMWGVNRPGAVFMTGTIGSTSSYLLFRG